MLFVQSGGSLVQELSRNSKPLLGRRFGYFEFFPARGRGRGSTGRNGGQGVGFLLKISGGGGAKYFFSGPKCPPSIAIFAEFSVLFFS